MRFIMQTNYIIYTCTDGVGNCWDLKRIKFNIKVLSFWRQLLRHHTVVQLYEIKTGKSFGEYQKTVLPGYLYNLPCISPARRDFVC